MIVSMNKNPDKYVEIFAEAYEFLEKHGLVDGSKDTFNSLAEYYGHMADFFDKQNYRYVMLPLDEDPFTIDLNTRTINVPASFSKCASVQSDQLAETIVFVADRYFDYMDLANTNIYVQWTVPADAKAGRPNAIEGATRVEMVDLETYPGQIRFAWPLNDAITQYAGNIKFAVRFFRIDNANEVIYSLNTLEATLVIKPALQPALNENSQVESPVNESAFRKAIVNSIFTNQGVTGPNQPSYSDPGSNIVVLEKDSATNEWMVKGVNDVNGLRIANLNSGNTLTLGVQAVVTDAGVLSYDWYYISNATGAVTKLTGNQPALVPCVPQPTAINPETELPYGRIGSTRYFTKTNSGTDGYELFVGNNFVNGTTYYELFDIYTIPADSAENPVAVTGKYYVDAWNAIPLNPPVDGKKSITVINPTRSDDCLLPGPMNVEFVAGGDLAAGAILQSGSKLLKVEVKADTYGAVPTYTWMKSTTEGDNKSYTTINNATGASYLASAPGWYKVKVESVVNREKKEATSAVCKVTNAPLPPVIKTMVDPVIDLNRDDAEFTVSLADNTNMSELLTEGFEGIWQIKPVDATAFTTIPENYQGVTFASTNFKNDTIKITDKIKASSAILRCLVSNTLNGQKAIFDHSGQGGVDAALGTFADAAPYTYEAEADDFFFAIQKI